MAREKKQEQKKTFVAIWEGFVIAESNDTVIVERSHYFPEDSIVKEHFKESEQTTKSWKGEVNYYHIVVDKKVNKNACYYYQNPKYYAEIKGRLSFWNMIPILTFDVKLVPFDGNIYISSTSMCIVYKISFYFICLVWWLR